MFLSSPTKFLFSGLLSERCLPTECTGQKQKTKCWPEFIRSRMKVRTLVRKNFSNVFGWTQAIWDLLSQAMPNNWCCKKNKSHKPLWYHTYQTIRLLTAFFLFYFMKIHPECSVLGYSAWNLFSKYWFLKIRYKNFPWPRKDFHVI